MTLDKQSNIPESNFSENDKKLVKLILKRAMISSTEEIVWKSKDSIVSNNDIEFEVFSVSDLMNFLNSKPELKKILSKNALENSYRDLENFMKDVLDLLVINDPTVHVLPITGNVKEYFLDRDDLLKTINNSRYKTIIYEN